MLKEDREVISEELSRIAIENAGKLTPDEVVKQAASKDSVLHDMFEWDDAKAGHNYRIEQARTLIRSVKVVVTTSTTQIATVAYVRDPSAKPDEQGYVSTVSLIGQTDLSRETLLREFSMAAAALKRARNLAKVFEMTDEVEAVVEKVETLTTIITSRAQPTQMM